MTYDSNVEPEKVSCKRVCCWQTEKQNKNRSINVAANTRAETAKTNKEGKDEIQHPAEVTETSGIPQIVLLRPVHQKFKKECRDTDKHTDTLPRLCSVRRATAVFGASGRAANEPNNARQSTSADTLQLLPALLDQDPAPGTVPGWSKTHTPTQSHASECHIMQRFQTATC